MLTAVLVVFKHAIFFNIHIKTGRFPMFLHYSYKNISLKRDIPLLIYTVLAYNPTGIAKPTLTKFLSKKYFDLSCSFFGIH